MNTISNVELKRPIWQSVAILTLGFWLSASLILDWVIMPGLYFSGMMTQSTFASAGYVLFWNFNRVELLSAGVILTSILAVCNSQLKWCRGAILLSGLLLAIALIDTYLLTPQMSAIGLQLNLFEPVVETPSTMNLLHGSYWILETVKLLVCGTLLSRYWQR
ncbi:MAG: hypothetical protein SAK29_41210 [Scytonema sp. PMC 1069.18]|nr:hypothetical protein [Scytonema sp. PMC 1069.18]MEC4882564.1 hypothetical protein [Scytonema sp. PMC 1070.18]